MRARRLDLLWVAMIIIAAAFVIFGNSLTDTNGFLSPDSTNYLRLSERLLHDHTLTVPNNGRAPAGDVYFSIWPIGYPALIAVFARILNLSTFLASKVLNIALLSVAVVALARRFGRNGIISSLILLTASALQIYSYTWSEAPFITILILYSIQLGGALTGHHLTRSHALLLTLLAVLLFLMRYVGAFAIAPLIITSSLLYHQGRQRDASRLLLSAMLALIIIITYLLINKNLAGYATGQPRIPAPESTGQLLRSFAANIVREFILPITAWDPHSMKQAVLAIPAIILTLLMLWTLWARRSALVKTSTAQYVRAFFIVGLTYLIAIIALRFRSQFDGFSYRLIAPGFIVILVGALLWAAEAAPAARLRLARYMTLMAVLSIAYHVYGMTRLDQQSWYFRANPEREMRYADIPDGAIVVFSNIHMNYLRSSLHAASPRYTPYSAEDETLADFLSDIDLTRPVYFEVGERAQIPDRYHESVREFIGALPSGEIISLDAAMDVYARCCAGR